jgi:hypothetical protein
MKQELKKGQKMERNKNEGTWKMGKIKAKNVRQERLGTSTNSIIKGKDTAPVVFVISGSASFYCI